MNDTKESLKLAQIYRSLAEMFTEHHQFLNVEANQQGNFISISPRAHKDDAAKLVGGGGETFHAMKVVLGCAADKLGVRFHLARVKDDHRTEKSDDLPPPVVDPLWPHERILALFRETCASVFKLGFEAEWEHQTRSKSVLKLVLSGDEVTPIPVDVVKDKLDVIFKAIGSANGHIIRVEVEKGNLNESDTVQGRAAHVPR